MKQRLGNKKIRRLRKETGLDVVYADVRGNTNHTLRFVLRDGQTGYRDNLGRITLCTRPENYCTVTDELKAEWPEVTE